MPGLSQRMILPSILLLACWRQASIAGGVPPGMTSNPSLPDACHLLPPEGGVCKALFTIAYYDPDRNACDEALYGGCGDGPVPFDDIADCRVACELGEALRLQEFRMDSERPVARLRVSFPSQWGDLPLRARVNDEEASSEVIARQEVNGAEILHVIVHLGAGPTRMVGVEVARMGQTHRALVRVHW